MSWQQRSKSLEVLADEKQNKALPQQNGHMTKKVRKLNRPLSVPAHYPEGVRQKVKSEVRV